MLSLRRIRVLRQSVYRLSLPILRPVRVVPSHGGLAVSQCNVADLILELQELDFLLFGHVLRWHVHGVML